MAGTPNSLPPVGTLSDYVSLATNTGGDSIQVLGLLNPWLLVIELVLDILELAGIIPDPIAQLIQLFTGRPREQASLEQAGRLMNCRNPAARQAGIMLERMVKEWDIVTSEGGSGRTILDAWAHLFVTNLTNQGVPLERAQQILVNATSRAAQAGLPCEPELTLPLAQGLTFNAPPGVAADFTAQYQRQIKAGKSIDEALKLAEQWLWKHEGLGKLFKVWIGQWIPPNPPPQQIVPNQGGTCPPGYTLDSNTEMCVLNIPPPPPGGGGGGGQGGGGQPDPEGDEITNDLCAQMGANTATLISAIQGLTPGGTPTDPACCENIVSAIEDVVTGLASVAANIGNISGGTPVDLSGVITAIEDLVAAVGKLAPTGGVDLSGVVEQLTRIANDLEKSAPVDTTGIVEQLKAIVREGDVKQDVINQLSSEGFISGADLQLLQGRDWADTITYLFRTYGERALEWLFEKAVPAIIAKDPAYWLSRWLTSKSMIDVYKGQADKAVTFITEIIKPALDTIIGEIKPAGIPAIGQSGVDADRIVGDIATFAIASGLGAWGAAFLGIDEGEPLAHLAELGAEIIGFKELREVQIGPLIRYGIARVAEQQAKKTFQQELPGAGEVMRWVARGLFDQARADELEALNGLHFSLRGPAQMAAYGGLQARMMVRAWESGLFSQGDLADELTFRGMRPASQKRMLLLAPWLATVSERNQLKAALEAAYVNGLLSDADLHQQLAQLDQNTDRDSLVMARVQLQQRVAFAKELEKSYSQAFTIGAYTEAQYRGVLEGIGLQASWINTKVAADQVHMSATAYRKELAAELALERATASEERRAAVKNFTTGNIDAAALLAALLLTGLNATQAAAWVDLAQLQKAGGLRWIYGLQLPSAAATLLRSRVTALSDQRKRLQITDPEFVSALQALGIPPHYVNSLRATADAMISPKTAAVTIPVETS